MNSIINKLNFFFKNTLKEIYNKHKKSNSRERIITPNDMIKYLFFYSNKNLTKSQAVTKINNASRTAYHNKLKSYNINFFNDIFDHLKDLNKNIINYDIELQNINKLLNNQIEVFNEDNIPYDICSADGTCNNEIKNSVLFTNSNVHIYNNSKAEPYSIINNDSKFKIFDNNKNNKSNKNGEISLLLKFIESTNDIELKNIIIILDRAYASYDLILKLNEKNIKYIIRLRDNFDIP